MRPVTSTGEPKARPTGRRIVLTTFGSLGDLYPYLAIAEGMQARGHEVVVATSRHHRQRVEAVGIRFSPLRPDGPDLDADRDAMRRIMDARKGTEFVVRELLMPALRQSFEDILTAADRADLLVSHVLTYATRLVAEKRAIRWASVFLQPLGFFSVYDPPVLPQIPSLSKLRFLGPAFHRALFWLAKRSCRSWGKGWHSLRAEIGLASTTDNPLFEGLYSPSLVLALFSQVFAGRQPDWPQQTVVTGFPFPDDGQEMPPDLVHFLDSGPPPIVFTLGSSAVLGAGPFYEHGAAAAKLLRRRAVLIIGKDQANRPASLPEGVVAFEHAPFTELFPRSCAVVHAGGIGTTGLGMRYGRPMLIMPCGHDQFDNAARVTRLGVARTISRRRYTPARVAVELRRLLQEPTYSQQALGVAQKLRGEDGVKVACDALEEQLPAEGRAEAAAK